MGGASTLIEKPVNPHPIPATPFSPPPQGLDLPHSPQQTVKLSRIKIIMGWTNPLSPEPTDSKGSADLIALQNSFTIDTLWRVGSRNPQVPILDVPSSCWCTELRAKACKTERIWVYLSTILPKLQLCFYKRNIEGVYVHS